MRLNRVQGPLIQIKNFKIASNSRLNQASASAVVVDEPMMEDDDDNLIAHYSELDLELGEADVTVFESLQKSRKIFAFNDFRKSAYDDTPFFAQQMATVPDIDHTYDGVVDYEWQLPATRLPMLKFRAVSALPDAFTNSTLVQKQGNQQRQDIRAKYGFVRRLHTYDEELRHYFDTIRYEKLTFVNLQFFNAIFLLYFLGLRPGYAERKGNKVDTYTGLLSLKKSSVTFSTTGDFRVHIYFIDKSKKDFDKDFFFPKNMFLALKDLLKVHSSQEIQQDYLFPSFVPKIKDKTNYLFSYNMRRFFGFSFSFRTFRVHAISLVCQHVLENLGLDTTCSSFQYEKHIRLLLATVAERFSNHTNHDNLVFYTDFRIFLVKARKIKIGVRELGEPFVGCLKTKTKLLAGQAIG